MLKEVSEPPSDYRIELHKEKPRKEKEGRTVRCKDAGTRDETR